MCSPYLVDGFPYTDTVLAILIFAGRSTRFWPLEEKSFFPVAGTTLIEEQVRRLRLGGIKNILLVAGKHNRAEAEVLFPDLKIVEQENLDLGMRGALLSSLPHAGNGPVTIVSANDLIDPKAYQDLLKGTKTLKSGGLILARKVQSYFPGGYLTVRGKRITGIVEKPEPGSEPSDLVNIVAHVHTSGVELLDALKKVKPSRDDGYEIALDTLLKRHPYEAVPYEGIWQPVKYPWHLLAVLEELLPKAGKPKIHRSAKIHKTAVIEGAVVIGPNVKVFAHASVMGPCTIGEGSIVANNALVRGSSVGRNCVIGYNTEVARSVLGDDVWTHSSYLGDSVLGSNISLGAGTTTGNLRLDEGEITSVVGGKAVGTGRTKLGIILGSGCRTGIHTCFAPGVKIGGASFISSAVMVTKDVPEGSFVKAKSAGELDIRKNHSSPSSPASRSGFRSKLK